MLLKKRFCTCLGRLPSTTSSKAIECGVMHVMAYPTNLNPASIKKITEVAFSC